MATNAQNLKSNKTVPLYELFETQLERIWTKLRDPETFTIFENSSVKLDTQKEFENFKDTIEYQKTLNENTTPNRRKLIDVYIYESIIGKYFDNITETLIEKELYEEYMESFENKTKFENTARIILEEGALNPVFFQQLGAGKLSPAVLTDLNKTLIEETINIVLYPDLLDESDDLLVPMVITEDVLHTIGRGIRGIALAVKNTFTLLLFLLVSPSTLLIGQTSTKIASIIIGKPLQFGKSEYNNITGFFDHLLSFGIRYLYQFLNNDLYNIADKLSDINKLADPDIQKMLKEIKFDRKGLIQSCWNKHKHIIGSNEDSKLWSFIVKFVHPKSHANALRSPLSVDTVQLAHHLKNDASNPTYQKMFYNFRVCVYTKLFQVIKGLAQTIYSIDDTSYEIIRAAYGAHKQRSFKTFLSLKPLEENEIMMFQIMRTLIAIESIVIDLSAHKTELKADLYIDKFVMFLKENIEQVYKELNETAMQRGYNKSRFDEKKTKDVDNAEALAKERFEKKRKLF